MSDSAVVAFDRFAGERWIYPNNMPIRPYQQHAVKLALFNNAMIVLPTGFGKTFIAAVVMYNFYLWFPTGKIIFVAPTRPLVAQQILECKRISGIPSKDCVQIDGNTSPGKRVSLWTEKRVFFCTPQVVQYDLRDSLLPASKVVLIVVDEAHKAQRNFAYVEVIRMLQEKNRDKFRILALSATPGADIDKVKQVMVNLYISEVMFRTENSIDLMSYRKQKLSKAYTLDLVGCILDYLERFEKICEPAIRELHRTGLLFANMDSLSRVTTYKLIEITNSLRSNTVQTKNKNRVGFITTAAMTMKHCFLLLTVYGIRPFFMHLQKKMLDGNLRSIIGSNIESDKLMEDIRKQFGDYVVPDPDKIESNPNINLLSGHPKLLAVKDLLEKHFSENATKPDTRALVFTKFRESVYDIVQTLAQTSALVKPAYFIGQKMDQERKLGMKQKDQIEIIKNFKEGKCNTLVATCVAEEGLDIGEIDLVVCYDVSSDPISGTQRRGRTGRKRTGDVIVLLSKDYEESKFKKSSQQKRTVEDQLYRRENYMTHRYRNAPRLIPDDLDPKCLEQLVSPPANDEEEKEKKPVRKSRARKASAESPPDSCKKAKKHNKCDDEEDNQKCEEKIDRSFDNGEDVFTDSDVDL